MRLATIVGEAARDVSSGTTRALLLALVFGVILNAAVAVALTDLRRAIAAADAYRASGASVTVLRAEGRIDGSACDAFSRTPGVHAAGALRAARDDLVPSALPSNPIPTREVSPGFPSVVRAGGGSLSGGGILSREVVDALSLPQGHGFATLNGTAQVAATFDFPDDGRQGDLGFSVLVPQVRDDVTPYDECWIDVWPQSTQKTSLLRTVIVPGVAGDDDERPTTSQLNSRLGTRFDGADALSTGLSSYAAGGAALAGFPLGATSIRLRRLELASARHAGVSRTAGTVGQLTQCLSWIVAGVAVSMPTLVLLSRDGDPAASWSLFSAGATAIAAGVVTALAGVVSVSLSTREKHLFRYFKDR